MITEVELKKNEIGILTAQDSIPIFQIKNNSDGDPTLSGVGNLEKGKSVLIDKVVPFQVENEKNSDSTEVISLYQLTVSDRNLKNPKDETEIHFYIIPQAEKNCDIKIVKRLYYDLDDIKDLSAPVASRSIVKHGEVYYGPGDYFNLVYRLNKGEKIQIIGVNSAYAYISKNNEWYGYTKLSNIDISMLIDNDSKETKEDTTVPLVNETEEEVVKEPEHVDVKVEKQPEDSSDEINTSEGGKHVTALLIYTKYGNNSDKDAEIEDLISKAIDSTVGKDVTFKISDEVYVNQGNIQRLSIPTDARVHRLHFTEILDDMTIRKLQKMLLSKGLRSSLEEYFI